MAKEVKFIKDKKGGIDGEVQRILTHLHSFFESNIHPSWVKAYKDYLLYTADR